MTMITGRMIRAARALCNLSQERLAQSAQVSIQTIKRLESFSGPIGATTRTSDAIIAVFDAHGVEFTCRPGEVVSVCQRRGMDFEMARAPLRVAAG